MKTNQFLKWIPIMVFILIQNIIYSQTITLKDNSNLTPISNALIYSVQNPKISVVTDNFGQAALTGFEKEQQLGISHLLYNTKIISLSELKNNDYLIYLTEKTNIINEIVISANRFESNKNDLAQPIEILNASEIKNTNAQTTGDVLQNTGNILVQKSQLGGGSPIIRGFETNKVLMAIDGVRMNNAIYRAGHIQNIITLDNAIMDKIEILYGPGSVVYGSDALGGVMHFYTKKPILADNDKLLSKINCLTRYSTADNEKTIHTDINLGWKKFASLTSFTYSDFGDLRQGNIRNPFYGDWGKRLFYVERNNGVDQMITNENPNVQVGSGYSQYDVLEKIMFKPNEKSTHLLNLQYSTSSDVNFYSRLQQMNGTNPKYAEWYYGPQKRLFGSYTVSSEHSSTFYDSYQTVIAYQNIEESRHDRKFNNATLNNRIEKLDIYSINSDFSKKSGKNDLKYGFEGVYNKVNSTAFKKNILTQVEAPLDTRYPNGGSEFQSYAVYVSHILKLNDVLTINDGLRGNYVSLNSKFDDKTFFPFPYDDVTQKNFALTGNIGLVLTPIKSLKVNLLASTGFRAPNVDDMSKVFESVPGSLVVPNPDLKPERTYNIDLGITKYFDFVTLGITSFYTSYKDAITLQPGTFNGQSNIVYNGQNSQVLTNVNKNKAYIYGLNSFVNADVTEHFSLYSTLNYTFGRFELEDGSEYPLDHVAPIFGKTGLVLKLNKSKTEFNALYNGWKRIKDYNLIGEDNIAEATTYGTPAWVTLNFNTSYQLTKNVQLQMALENILDQNYKIFASGISAPGRNFIISLKGNF